MCRSIQQLRPPKGSDAPPAGHEEIEAAALQFVRKVSGFRQPAAHNREPFEAAIRDIAEATERLLATLQVR